MEIKFLKDHLEYKTGDKAEVSIDRANYFISVGVAKKYVKPKPKKETE